MKLPHLPLYTRVIIAVALGAILGLVAGKGDIVLGISTADLGALGMLVIRLLKMLAVPLVLFAVLDAIARTDVTPRMGFRLLAICLLNVTVAFTIGLALMNTIRPGDAWQGHIQDLAGLTHEQARKAPEGTTLSPLDNLQKWVPESVAQPFSENNVISIVLLAILAGAAIRRVRREAKGDEERTRSIHALIDAIEGGYRVLMRMLTWVVEAVPYAVFGVVAMTIGKAGFETFGVLAGFLGVILLGFALHALGYSPLMAWIGGKSPRVFFGKGAGAIVTGLSMNSSLATMPVTLQALDAIGVSPESARLSACIGTNFNNDGITLYEAMAAVFLAQALGYDLSVAAQLTIVLAALMAGVGIAGVPEAGLIVLPLVLHAAGLPEQVVAALIPLIFTVDWILARCRSAVNVMADMLVAILLDRWARARGSRYLDASVTEQSSITRKLFSLSAPIIGINTLNVLMLAVDSALCGRLPEREHALAALGFSVQVVFLLMVLMLGLIVGTVALVARAHGGGDHARVDHVVRQSTMLTAIVGVAVGVLGAIAAEPILRAMGASASVAGLGADYLQPLMIGTPFWYLTLVYTGILRAVGNTRIPFICAIIANIINAVLNYGLVLGNLGMPSLGVTGSAIGTVTAQLVNLVILIVVLKRGAVAGLRPALSPTRIDRKLAVELFKVGWPAAIDMLVINAGFLTALGMLGRIDEVTVAAHGLGLRVQSLAFVPGLSIAQATGALVGQALGAGDVPRAKQTVRASLLLCVLIMSALAVIMMVAARPLVHIFDVKAGTPLESYSVEWMQLLGIAMFPSAVHLAFVGLFQGAGATMTSLRINIWTTVFVQIPLSYVFGFAFDWGAWGVWLAFPVVFAAKVVFVIVAYRTEAWAVTGVRLPGKRP